jgi:hypothetical protein
MTDYENFPGKASYKYWEIFGRDNTDPWVLDDERKQCLLKCDIGYWSNYGLPNNYTSSTVDP